MKRTFKRFVQFRKEFDDDLREVWGDATVEEVDKQKEMVAFSAATKAFEIHADYFQKASRGKSKGNVREMHQPIAAGRIIAWEADEKRKAIPIGTKIDDDAAWKKCKAGTYIGFSIAGEVTKEHKAEIDGETVNVIDEFDLVEVSLVDNPACAGAVFSVVKIAKGDPEPEPEPAPAPAPAEPAPAPAPTPEPSTREKLDALLKAEKDPTTIQTLIFEKDKFESAAAAKKWASDHDFKNSKVDETDDTYRLRQRDPGDFKDGSFRTIELKEGVKAVVGHLKLATPRFGKILKALAGSMRKQGSESMSIYPALCALGDMQRAMESEAFQIAMGEDAETEKGDIATLGTAVEAILEFVGNEFAEEIRSWASATAATGPMTPFAYVEQVTTLQKALSPLQVRKMGDDVEMMENLGAIHKMGHALVKATDAMGSGCPDGDCPDADAGAGGDDDEGAGDDDTVPPKKDGEGDDAGAEKARKVAAPASVSEVRATEKILGEIRKVGREVGDVKSSVKALDARIEKVEKLPAPIGRTPAGAVDKSLPRVARADDDPLALLRRGVEEEKDPNKKTVLAMFLTQQTIKLQQAGYPVE